MAKLVNLTPDDMRRPSAPEAKVAKRALDLYEQCFHMRADMVRMFAESRYLTFTQQALAFDFDERGQIRFRAMKGVPKIPRTQINRIFPVIQKTQSKLRQRDIDWEPDSYGATSQAIEAINAAKAHIRFLKDEFKTRPLYAALANALPHAGSMFVKIHHDGNGRLTRSLVWPWEVSFPLHVTHWDLDDCPEWVHTYTMPLDAARAKFGQDVQADGTFSTLTDQLCNIGLTGDEQGMHNEQAVFVHEYFDRRPGTLKQYPNGRIAVIVGRKTPRHIMVGSSPYPLDAMRGESPLTKYDNIRAPGRFFGISTTSLLFLEQLGYNTVVNDIMQSIHIANQQKVLAPEGSVPNRSQLTSIESGIVEYIPGAGEVTPLTMNGPHPQSWTMLDKFDQAMREIPGVQSGAQWGQSEGRIEATSAYRLLLDESDSVITMTLKDLGEPLSRFMWRLLRCYVAEADPRRIIEVIGEEGFPEQVNVLRQEVLKQTNFRIKVTADSLTPRNEQDVKREAMQVAEMAARGGDPMVYLQLVGDEALIRRLKPEMVCAREQARRENRLMSQLVPEAIEEHFADLFARAMDPENPTTTPVEAYLFDMAFAPHAEEVHAEHLQEHRRFMNRSAFYQLPDPAKQLFEWHAKAHRLYTAMGEQADDASQVREIAGHAARAAQPQMPSGERYTPTPTDKPQAAAMSA